jgi:hypothetical protein
MDEIQSESNRKAYRKLLQKCWAFSFGCQTTGNNRQRITASATNDAFDLASHINIKWPTRLQMIEIFVATISKSNFQELMCLPNTILYQALLAQVDQIRKLDNDARIRSIGNLLLPNDRPNLPELIFAVLVLEFLIHVQSDSYNACKIMTQDTLLAMSKQVFLSLESYLIGRDMKEHSSKILHVFHQLETCNNSTSAAGADLREIFYRNWLNLTSSDTSAQSPCMFRGGQQIEVAPVHQSQGNAFFPELVKNAQPIAVIPTPPNFTISLILHVDYTATFPPIISSIDCLLQYQNRGRFMLHECRGN